MIYLSIIRRSLPFPNDEKGCKKIVYLRILSIPQTFVSCTHFQQVTVCNLKLVCCDMAPEATRLKCLFSRLVTDNVRATARLA